MDSPAAKVARLWSWKAHVLFIALAMTTDLLLLGARLHFTQPPLPTNNPYLPSPLWVIGAIGILGVLALFWSSMSGLVAVIFIVGLLTYTPFQTGAFSRFFPGNVVIGLFLMLWVLRYHSGSRRRLFQPDLINAPLFAMVLAIVLSMIWARMFPDPLVNYSYLHSNVSWTMAQVVELFLIGATVCLPFAVAAAIKNWRDVEKTVLAMGIVMGAGTLLTILALVFGFGSAYSILGSRRAYWTQPWNLSMPELAAPLLPFLYCAVLFGRRSIASYRTMCLLLVLCLVGVSLTFSRESWVLATLGLLLVTALRLRKSFVKVFAFTATAALLLATLAPGAVKAITSFYNPNEVYGLGRMHLYEAGLRFFMTHPLFGVGAADYEFFDRAYPVVEASGMAHQQFVTVAAETGVFGLSMLLWLLFRLLRIRKKLNLGRRWSKDPHYWVKAGGNVFLLLLPVQFFFGEALFTTAGAGGGALIFLDEAFNWILIGVVFAVCTLSRRDGGERLKTLSCQTGEPRPGCAV